MLTSAQAVPPSTTAQSAVQVTASLITSNHSSQLSLPLRSQPHSSHETVLLSSACFGRSQPRFIARDCERFVCVVPASYMKREHSDSPAAWHMPLSRLTAWMQRRCWHNACRSERQLPSLLKLACCPGVLLCLREQRSLYKQQAPHHRDQHVPECRCSSAFKALSLSPVIVYPSLGQDRPQAH